MDSRVLVVDDDPWIVRMVSASLEKRQYVVDTAKEGRQALARVDAARPDVIITDLMMPVMDGWTFVQQLRTNPASASIPVIVLTALGKDEMRLAALGFGPDDCVAKPFRFDDLAGRVAHALERPPGVPSPGDAAQDPTSSRPAVPYPAPFPSGYPTSVGYPAADGYPSGVYATYPETPSAPAAPSVPEPPPRRPTALNGRLEQLQLSSLLVMMELERKAGVLTLKGSRDQVGRIFLRNGQVVSARVDGRSALAGRDSVYEMLCWNTGTFSFNAMEVDMDDAVQSTTTHLLMEGARLIDEARRGNEKSR